MSPEEVAALYHQHGIELRRFLVGVLRDEHLADDAMQAAFVRAIEVGHTSREESRKAWLFRVAFNEALVVRRREATRQRVLAQIIPKSVVEAAQAATVTREEIERVREALADLPPEQQQVVRMRVHDRKTFAQIAEELRIPLGTALTRMRTALARLRHALRDL